VVDENDIVVSNTSRDDCHKRGLLHRSVEVFVFKDSSLKEILIQKRGIKNEFSPEKLCGSAGGHVTKGETYHIGAIRELREELFTRGVPKTIKLRKIDKFKINDFPRNYEIKVLYYTIYNKQFDWSRKDLLEEPKFVKIKDLIEDIKSNPERYTKAFKISFGKFLNKA
jgi:isopentenyldiphosphate isomerase